MFEKWLAQVEGQFIDIDKYYGSQCVDVTMHYVQYLFNKPWAEIMGRGDAKDMWRTFNLAYFDKIPNEKGNPNQVPQAGDIVVWDATNTNIYGHIAVCIAADANKLVLMEQDGFIDRDNNGNADGVTYRKTRYWSSNILGWFRPKLTQTQGVTLMNDEAGVELYRTALMREPESVAAARQWNGQTPAQALRAVRGVEWQAVSDAYRNVSFYKQAIADRDKKITELQTILANEQNKPAKEIIKEVQVVVDRPVEVVKEVVVEKEVIKEVEPSWVIKARSYINKFFAAFTKWKNK